MPKTSIRKTKPNSWQLQTAKARFSELFRLTRDAGPQMITRQGKDTVVMIPLEQFEQLTAKGKPKESLLEFFRQSPLVGIELNLERNREMSREIKL